MLPRLAAQGYLPAELGDVLRSQHGGDARRGKRRMMAPLHCGHAVARKLLRRLRAGEARSPFAAQEYAAAATIDVTSPAFTDGGAMPQKHAGKGVGDNVSPQLHWTGVPADTSSWC